MLSVTRTCKTLETQLIFRPNGTPKRPNSSPLAGQESRKAADLKKTPPPPPDDDDDFIDDDESIRSDTSSMLGYASDPVFPRQKKKMAKNKTFKY